MKRRRLESTFGLFLTQENRVQDQRMGGKKKGKGTKPSAVVPD
jgi:hypothetical protein